MKTLIVPLLLCTAAVAHAAPEDEVSPAQAQAAIKYWTQECTHRTPCPPAGISLPAKTVVATPADSAERARDISKLTSQKESDIGSPEMWFALYVRNCKMTAPFKYKVDIANYKVTPGHVIDAMMSVTEKIQNGCLSSDNEKTGPWWYRKFFQSVKTLYFKSDPSRLGDYATYQWDAKTGTLTVSNFDMGINMTTDQAWQKLLAAHEDPKRKDDD